MTTINDMIKNNEIHYDNLEVCGFVGPIGSGKSTRANKLIEEGFYPIAFADELREKCWQFLYWRPKNDEEYENCRRSDN